MLTDSQRQWIDKALAWVLTVALLVALLGVIYVAVTPQSTGEAYTQFYVLGPNGSASGYPTNLSVGERGEFILGITNNENRDLEYTIVVSTNGSIITKRTVTVGNEENWEGLFAFTPDYAGKTQLNILLYRGSDPDVSAEPYRRLRLIIDVHDADT